MNSLEGQILEKMGKMGKTLSLAESCTGGYVAHRLTLQAGASSYFLGGIVCYSNSSKIDLLGVDPFVVEEGAVSETVARQLAEGALRVFHSDYSLAITGLTDPRGGAWLAVGEKGKATKIWHFSSPFSTREEIIKSFTQELLEKFLKLA